MGKMTAALVTVLVAVAGQPRAEPDPGKTIDREAGCAKNPSVVGPCFEVQGRAVIGNGTPGFRIMQAGTTRILGVLPAENEIVPACLARGERPGRRRRMLQPGGAIHRARRSPVTLAMSSKSRS